MHQVVLTASATQQALYVDGKLVGTEAATIDDLSMSDTYLAPGTFALTGRIPPRRRGTGI